MRKLTWVLAAAFTFAAVPAFTGCNKTEEEHKKTDTNPDGSQTKSDVKVEKKTDGTSKMTHTEEVKPPTTGTGARP